MRTYLFALAAILSLLANGRSYAQMPMPPGHFRSFPTSEELAARRAKLAEEAKNYGVNIIRLIPLRSIDGGGIGVGLGYEHIFGAEKNIGLVLPLTIRFRDNNFFNNNSPQINSYMYFTPGIKIYPGGQRKVSYAVGPSLMFGYGKISGYHFFRNTNEEPRMRFRMGVFANNYLNVQLTPQFNFGVELGIGVRYMDKAVDGYTDTYNEGVMPMQNFALSFGYRF